jgi:hypothetical protein
LLSCCFILLQNSRIQTYVAKKITEVISENLKTRFTIESVDITFFNKVRLNKFYIEDLNHDTLLYADRVSASILKWPGKKRIPVNTLTLDNATLRLAKDSAGTLNLAFIIDAISKKDTTKPSRVITIRNIKFKDSKFALILDNSDKGKEGIDFSNLALADLNTNIRRLSKDADTVNFIIKSLSFRDHSGFEVENFYSKTSICKNHLDFKSVIIKTQLSKILAEKIILRFNSFEDFDRSVLYDKVRLDILLYPSELNLNDLAFFAPGIKGSAQQLNLSGEIKGYISNLKGRNINISYGENSEITCEFNSNGLPDFKETFLYINLEKFRTTISDLTSLELPGGVNFDLSKGFRELTDISYKGKFTGFIDDFVAYGDMESNLGKISTDLSFKPDTNNYFTFKGQLKAERFNIGKLLGNEKNIGMVTLNVIADGYSCSGKTINAEINGIINSLEIKRYKYQNIKLSGILSDKTYNGSIIINDPNVNLEFMGMVDFSSDIYDVDFTANVSRANLFALNFDRKDSVNMVSFFIRANVQGSSIDNLNGEVILLNSLLAKSDKQIQIYDFRVYAKNNADSNSLVIRSDILDADIYGSYQMAQVRESLNRFIYSYLPSLVNSESAMIDEFKNGFHFTVNFKKTKPIFEYFLPQYYIAENTLIKGRFDPDTNNLYLSVKSPRIEFFGNTWKNVYFSCQSNDSIFSVVSGSESLTAKDKINLENFTIYSDISNDSVNLMIRWNNWDTVLYKGIIKAVTRFIKEPGHKSPLISLNILPTQIITTDTLWNINRCQILIDSTSILIDNFKVNHNDQSLRLDGKISSKPVDKIVMEFNNFNLGNINIFTRSEGMEIKGILNGDAEVSNFYSNPVFYSRLAIDTLVINDERLGHTIINSAWNNDKKSISIDAVAKRGMLNTIAINGDYFPKDEGKLQIDIEMNKLRLNIINPYLQAVFVDCRGIASGNLNITGNTSEPVLNGDLKFQKTAFTISYLNTRYNFTDHIKIINNNIFFSNIKLIDIYGNFAYLNGIIQSNYLRDFNFNLKIDAENLLFLNTTQSDNTLFYGTAFATGFVTLKGAPKNVIIDAGVSADKNTKFYIPLSNESEISQYNFVTFLYEDTAGKVEDEAKEYKVDLSALNLNVDLEVTPDAEVQLIFDPKVGDIMKSRGYGNLNLQVNTLGRFNIFGEYHIEEGDYLFTMQNVINRKFNIDNGVIRWNGDPLDAYIDIKAIYPTKAALYDLFGTELPGEEAVTGNGESAYRRKTTVYCQLLMTDKLMKPNVKYDIYLPSLDDETRALVNNEINTEEELNKQFISLLVLNRFMPKNSEEVLNLSSSSNVAGVNASEFLSNQLSNWLSQISSDYDIRVNYRPGFDNQMTNDEVELALSTQLLNDRLSINGNVDVTTNATAESSNNIVGDFDLDYKITEKLRLKAYNHSNDKLLTELSPYTQGVGVVFKEEFNNLGELWKRYVASLFRKGGKNTLKK